MACGHRQAMVGHGHGGAEWMELNYSLEPGPSGCSLFKFPGYGGMPMSYGIFVSTCGFFPVVLCSPSIHSL